METGGLIGRCESCKFWKAARPNEGWCLRLAPHPAGSPDPIAHWPTTHGSQGCGEFAHASAALDIVACRDCRFWDSPENGLHPVDRGDRPAQWWSAAGKCRRYAPAPQSEPGPRAFWRASHADDSCAEGLVRPHPREK
jgi:hypothetical protein